MSVKGVIVTVLGLALMAFMVHSIYLIHQSDNRYREACAEKGGTIITNLVTIRCAKVEDIEL